MKGKLYAIWSYDKFPYFTGGEVEQLNDDGTVYVKGYGNHRMQARLLVPGRKGKILLDRGKALRASLEREKRELYNHHIQLMLDEFTAQGVESSPFKYLKVEE
jgi:hypothetical protein